MFSQNPLILGVFARTIGIQLGVVLMRWLSALVMHRNRVFNRILVDMIAGLLRIVLGWVEGG